MATKSVEINLPSFQGKNPYDLSILLVCILLYVYSKGTDLILDVFTSLYNNQH